MRVFNKKTTQHSITLMLVLLGAGYNLNAEVYRWKDSKGITHYSDQPPTSITEKKSEALLLKIIKSDNYCAPPTSPNKVDTAPIDFSNNYFFSNIRSRLNVPQAARPGLASTASAPNLASARPSATSTASAPNLASSPPRVAPGHANNSLTNASRPAANLMRNDIRPAASGLPLNAFRPLPFNTVTRSTPNGVSVAALNLPRHTLISTPVAISTPPASSNNPPAPALAPSPAQAPNVNLAVAAPNSATSNGGSFLPVVDISKTPAGDIGFSNLRIRPATHDGVHTDKLGAFRTDCAITHYSNDDPIIYPGVQGAAHHHTFFGNAAVNFATTSESILTTGNSSCAGGIANRSGYWIPSIIDTKTGAPIKPFRGIIYYKQGLPPAQSIRTPPKGLRMIAGDMNINTTAQITQQPANAQGREPAKFLCVNESANPSITGEGKLIPACRKAADGRSINGFIRLMINFPQCWDGKNLDSPDHKSHMAYSYWEYIDARGKKYWPESKCPTTHPIALPEITEIFDFEVTDAVHGTDNWRLSSDNYPSTTRGGLSLHADWMNGWDEDIMSRIVKNCLNKSIDCGVNYLGDGETLY